MTKCSAGLEGCGNLHDDHGHTAEVYALAADNEKLRAVAAELAGARADQEIALAAAEKELAEAKVDLEGEDAARAMHADLNKRAAEALGKPRVGEGSSWHDIPECITALRKERDEWKVKAQQADYDYYWKLRKTSEDAVERAEQAEKELAEAKALLHEALDEGCSWYLAAKIRALAPEEPAK